MSGKRKDVNCEQGASSSAENFPYALGDVVLVRWSDERIYYAKIKTINKNRQTCQVMFEDSRRGTADFNQIHAVDSVVEDWIACIVCKFGTSDPPNQIVLCDECGVAYHQKCHRPRIPDSALELSAPWACYFCEKDKPNPYLKDGEDNIPSFDEDDENSQQVKKRSSSSKEDTSSRLKLPKSRTIQEDREDSSYEGSTDASWKSESDDAVFSTIGKRKRKKSRDIPEPAVKKAALSTLGRASMPTKSSPPDDNSGENSRLQAGVTDSGKVAAYAKWKQKKLQTSKNDLTSLEIGVEATGEPQTQTTDPDHESSEPPRVCHQTEGAEKSQQATDRSEHSTTSQKPSTSGMSRRSVRKSAPRRYYAPYYAANGTVGDTYNAQQMAYYIQQHTTGAATRVHTSDILKGIAPKYASLQRPQPSSVNLPLSSLAKQFEQHYNEFIKSFQTARLEPPNSNDADSQEKKFCVLGNPLHGSKLHCAGQDVGKDVSESRSSSSSAVIGEKIPADEDHQSSSEHSTQETQRQRNCVGCGEHARLACSRCENAWYCSAECRERCYMVYCQKCTSFD